MVSPQAQKNKDLLSIERLRELVQLMEEHQLGEVELRQENQRVRIQRGLNTGNTSAYPIAGSQSADAHAPAAPPRSSDPASVPVDEAHVAVIKSPMVGTFYTKPNPDAEPFIKVGDPVGPETIVCIIEAMKVFNEIPADVSGRIVSVLVENEEPVEFGKPLFKVDTSS